MTHLPLTRLFRSLIALCLACTLCMHQTRAQTTLSKKQVKELSRNIEDLWKKQDQEFISAKVPDKWKDRSGVILAQRTNLQLVREPVAKELELAEFSHYKIWVHDKDAVKTYSTLYLSVNKYDNGFAARVTKAGGAVRDLDLSAAVIVENEGNIPDLFKPYLEQGSLLNYMKATKVPINYYKLAVPDLEPGDIIEYAWKVNTYVDLRGMDFYEMDPVYYLFNQDLPVVYQGYEFRSDSRTYFSARSINGAPEFKQSTEGKWDVYRVEDRDRDKIEDARWVNKYLMLPLSKFQVVYARPGHGASKQLLIGDKEGMRTNVDLQEMAVKTRNAYRELASDLHANIDSYHPFVKFYVGEEINKATRLLAPNQFPQKAYYVFRHEITIHEQSSASSYYFAVFFRELLKTAKIKADLILTTRNDLTTPANLLFKDELEWLLRVDDKLIYRFNIYSNFVDVSPVCEGNDAYIIDPDKKEPTPEKITLPETGPKDNESASLIAVTLDKNKQDLSVNATSAFSGLARFPVVGPVLYNTNAFMDDHKIYGRADTLDRMQDVSKKENAAELKRMYAEMAREASEKPAIMKKVLEKEYKNVVRYDEFTLQSDGRNHESPLLKYSEKYILGDMVRTAGKNLLVSLPNLIGGQTQISPEEAHRQYDIDVQYAKTLRWRIVFDIPAGYQVGDLGDLNSSVDNATGSFVATAKVDKDQLVLDIIKVYKHRREKKEDWELIRAFIDAAYNYSQKKILLRKTDAS